MASVRSPWTNQARGSRGRPREGPRSASRATVPVLGSQQAPFSRRLNRQSVPAVPLGRFCRWISVALERPTDPARVVFQQGWLPLSHLLSHFRQCPTRLLREGRFCRVTPMRLMWTECRGMTAPCLGVLGSEVCFSTAFALLGHFRRCIEMNKSWHGGLQWTRRCPESDLDRAERWGPLLASSRGCCLLSTDA
jgi:hypothetical protein